MFSPEPPQGFTSEQSQVVIQRQPIPLFSPPQRRRGGPAVQTFRVLATFPPAATGAFDFFRFYQIKKNQVPTTQTNMPLVIIDTLGAGSILEPSGFDIRVFDSNGMALPYEVSSVNTVTGDIIVWVNVSTVADGEFVQLAFGNATATDGSNPNAVYDANYQGVYHLNETSFGVGTIIDSTSNGNDADTILPLSSITGKVGKALSFGSLGHLDEGTALMADMNDVGTVSMWVNIDDLDDTGSFFRVFYNLVMAGNSWSALIETIPNPNVLTFRYGSSPGVIEVDLPLSVFDSGEDHLFTFTWDQPNSIARIYIDGVVFATNTTPWALGITSADITTIANLETGQAFLSLLGSIDEPRFSDTIRDSDWILTEFNNQNDNDAFWFKSPILTVSQNNFLVDDLGNNIVTEIP